MELLSAHIPYLWALGAGLALMMGELLLPVTVYLWTGISCVLVGGVLFFDPQLPLYAALLLWAGLSAATILAVKALHRGPHAQDRRTPEQPPNRYGSDFVGMTASLSSDSSDGLTRLNLKGANWGVKLPAGDLKAGHRVKITGVDGIFLVAEPE